MNVALQAGQAWTPRNRAYKRKFVVHLQTNQNTFKASKHRKTFHHIMKFTLTTATIVALAFAAPLLSMQLRLRP